jgi:hypothetical protein
MFDHIGSMLSSLHMPLLLDPAPTGPRKTQWNNRGQHSIAGREHLHLREIARRGTRPGSEARRQAMADVAHYNKTGRYPGEPEVRVFV